MTIPLKGISDFLILAAVAATDFLRGLNSNGEFANSSHFDIVAMFTLVLRSALFLLSMIDLAYSASLISSSESSESEDSSSVATR